MCVNDSSDGRIERPRAEVDAIAALEVLLAELSAECCRYRRGASPNIRITADPVIIYLTSVLAWSFKITAAIDSLGPLARLNADIGLSLEILELMVRWATPTTIPN